MKKELINIKGYGGISLQGIMWLPEETPKALLQVTHGMTEHISRYTRLAEELTAQGIVVAGLDLRGHGTNPSTPNCASFGENGWEASLEDIHLLYQYLGQRFSDCPHFMLGFSLGSFLLREYLNRYPDNIAGAAILGTGYQPGPILSIIMAITKTQIKKTGFDYTTPLVKKLSFETYNQKFAPNKTIADWLCSDKTELNSYLADSLCRESISAGLFFQLLGAMKRTGSRSAYKNWNKDIPILLLSGKEDPVGDAGKGVAKVKHAMDHAGLKNVTMYLFSGARHDLLHEEISGSAEQARQILLDWILKICKQ